MKNLIVIPARGGSKGIPRKNLRPVSNKPLIFYSITASLNSNIGARVVVTTDDDEIALFAKRFGAEVLQRNKELAGDEVTLDPVIFDAFQKSEALFNEKYEFILTVQPTSPLISEADINNVVLCLKKGGGDTVLTVVDDRHLCWTKKDNQYVPAYAKRVNRQELPLNYKETGAVIACTRKQIESGVRVGKNVDVSEVPYERSFDIDSYSDLYLCEAMMNRKKIVFTVVGYPKVGLGHAFRTVMLAHELVQYEIVFVCDYKSQLAKEYIEHHNYQVIVANKDELHIAVLNEKPDLVINDILDTSVSYMNSLKEGNLPVVNFEDMGSGAKIADLVINALYPHQVARDNFLIGPKYFCLRDEFLYLGSRSKRGQIKRVLITFGGVDEGNITLKTVEALTEICILNDILLEVVIGPGYQYLDGICEYIKSQSSLSCNLIEQTKRISDHMVEADVAFTSGGRTVLELASLQVPTVVICQNDREMSHTFASSENGVLNLGHRLEVSKDQIACALEDLLNNNNKITEMKEKMGNLDLTRGKKRVIDRIKMLMH